VKVLVGIENLKIYGNVKKKKKKKNIGQKRSANFYVFNIKYYHLNLNL